MTTLPDHELLWLSCAAKRCCSLRTVRPTGGDIWRIATQLHVPPESFLRSTRAEPDADDGVLLAPTAQPVQLALARRATQGRQAACVFLMQLGDAVARCGLGELRPLPCQAFPGCTTDDALRIQQDHGCTCRTWNLADLDRPAVAALLEREAAERALDRRLIQAWNEQVRAEGGRRYILADFCGYLTQAYAAHMAVAAGTA